MSRTPTAERTIAASALTSDRMLGRSTAWSLAGQVAPLLTAIVLIPPLIRELGTDRFGTLALIWIVAGYLGIFDLGLGAALTKYAAGLVAADRQDEIGPLARRALAVMLGIGLVAGLALFLAAPWLADRVLHTSPLFRSEVAASIRLVALVCPVITTTSGMSGLLAAYQRFDVINAIGMPLSGASYVAAVVVAAFRPTLPAVVLSLVVIDLVGWGLTLYFCRRCTPTFAAAGRTSVGMSQLARFGGWSTLANCLSPLLVYVDRLFLGARVSTIEVAYYSTPYSVITRVLIFPSAVAQVLFPALAMSSAGQPRRFRALADRACVAICAAVLPLAVLAIVFARPMLDLWVGNAFAANSSGVLRVLAIGVFVNAPAVVPYSLLQAVGRPDIIAKLYLAELVPYFALLWVLVSAHGIEGAAVAWTARCAVDCVLLLVLMLRVVPTVRRAARRAALAIAFGCLALALAFIPLDGALRVALAAAVLGCGAFAGWTWILGRHEKRYLRMRLRAVLADTRVGMPRLSGRSLGGL
jgi:O-antigen/teichoic acid export membrane protein